MNKVALINKYDEIQNNLSDSIKKSDYKVGFFMEKLNLKSGFFYKKLREKRFTSEEMKTISRYLFPNEYRDYENERINKLLLESKNQIVKGDTKEIRELLKTH